MELEEQERVFHVIGLILECWSNGEHGYNMLPIESADFMEWAPKTHYGTLKTGLLDKRSFLIWCLPGVIPSIGKCLFRKHDDRVYFINTIHKEEVLLGNNLIPTINTATTKRK